MIGLMQKYYAQDRKHISLYGVKIPEQWEYFFWSQMSKKRSSSLWINLFSFPVVSRDMKGRKISQMEYRFSK